MSRYTATIEWKRRDSEPFVDLKYSRAHQWRFDGGAQVAASASPHIVPLPHSVAANVDPEEAFVASLSSCHMLMFLSLAAKRGFVVDSYTDEAEGVLERDDTGHLSMTSVTLMPHVTYRSQPPDRETEHALHHSAHEGCFIANSVKTQVRTRLPER
jgi:organic hydroperoxide reductase OsmC/OhrA